MPKWTKSKTARYFYKDYKFKKDKNNSCYLDRKKHRAILEDFFELIQQHLIKGNVYYPPYGMGEFRITKNKAYDVKIRNHHLEKKHYEKHGVWKKVNLQNFHTNGQIARVRWYKRGYSLIPLKSYYFFSTGKKFRVNLGKYLLSNGDINNYYVTGKNTKLKDIKTLI